MYFHALLNRCCVLRAVMVQSRYGETSQRHTLTILVPVGPTIPRSSATHTALGKFSREVIYIVHSSFVRTLFERKADF